MKKLYFYFKSIFLWSIAIFLILIAVNLTYLMTMQEWENDCMIDYVNKYYPFWYNYDLWEYNHIEWYNPSLSSYVVWKTYKCMVIDDSIWTSITNTIYCGQVKIMKEIGLDQYIFYKYSDEFKTLKEKILSFKDSIKNEIKKIYT